MRSDTGTVHECGPSAKCEFHRWGGSPAQPCSPVEGSERYFTLKSDHNMPQAVHALESWMIESALKRAGGSAKLAAEMLGLTRQGLLFIVNPEKGRHKELAGLVISQLPTGGARPGAGRKAKQ